MRSVALVAGMDLAQQKNRPAVLREFGTAASPLHDWRWLGAAEFLPDGWRGLGAAVFLPIGWRGCGAVESAANVPR